MIEQPENSLYYCMALIQDPSVLKEPERSQRKDLFDLELR